MKSVLIVLGLSIALVIGVMSNASEIGQWALVKISEEEGGMEKVSATFEALKANNPKGFVERYESSFKDRCRLVKISGVLGNKELFFQVANSTVERYMDSPLQTDEKMGLLYYEKAKQHEALQQWNEAWQFYQLYRKGFPEGSKKAVVQSAVNALSANRGFHE